MNFHWMQNNDFFTMKKLATDLESVGYESVLLTYNSNSPDLFFQAIDALADTKIKYNIAIRPHSISPEYLAMIAEAANSAYPGRLMFNFVSGNFYENENLDGIIHHDIAMLADIEYRRRYLSIFLDKFLARGVLSHYPTCMVGTSSRVGLKICQKYNLTLAVTYDNFMIRKDEILNSNLSNILINLPVILRPTIEEAVEAQNNIVGPGDFGDRFFVGDANTLSEKIFELKGYNVNNVMLGCVPGDSEDFKNHTEIKKVMEAIDV